MIRRLALSLCAVFCSQLALAEDLAADDQRFFQDAADCAAALEARVIDRQTQPRTDARDDAMRRDVAYGFVFVGVAYKRGLRNPQADEMLHAAEKRWLSLNKADKDARQAMCTSKGQALMDDVSMLERFLVRNRADARVERLLEKEREKQQEKDKP